MQVIAHGGAGSPPDEPGDRQAVLEEAVACGREQETPLDAVCATVRVLEVDPGFNAGVGGAVQSDGVVRTDAGLMTGDREVGAVCSMPDVCHAVDAARAVLEETPHVLLAGERAVEFAADVGVETGVDLWTDETRRRWSADRADAADYPDGVGPDAGPLGQLEWLRERFGQTDPGGREGGEDDTGGANGAPSGGPNDANGADPTGDDRAQEARTDGQGPADHRDHDTVGAVACDGETVAAATSTGGRWLALAGRVGDVPQVGAGFYASPAGGASATGAGEDIARYTLSRRAVELLERGADAETAARLAIEEFDERADGDAGIIVVDADGGAGEAYNSPAMQTARQV